MHPCLAVEEIVELVARFAQDEVDEAWSKRLVRLRSPAIALAQTCKSFYEPACNVRWSLLKSVQPLLRLFKPDLSVVSSKGPIPLEVRSHFPFVPPRNYLRVRRAEFHSGGQTG